MGLGLRRLVLIATLALVLVPASPAQAGTVTTVVEAPTPYELAIAVSEHAFGDGEVDDVVLAPADDRDLMAIAAGLTGGTPLGAPLLLVPPGGTSPEALLDEVDRVTGGSGGGAEPTIWLVGVADPGLAGRGYGDRRSFAGTTAEVAAGVLDFLPGGNESRVLLVSQGDGAAGGVAGAFGASYGIPVVPLPDGPLPPALAEAFNEKLIEEAVAIGDVVVPPGFFTRERRVTGSDPSVLSVNAANDLFATEQPDGFPIEAPAIPVAADGFGSEPAPALLAAVVSTRSQDDGGNGPLLLVDGRPAADPQGSCSANTDRDAPSSCAIAAAPGDTTLVTLTSTTRPAGPPAGGGGGGEGDGGAGDGDPGAATRLRGRLPATGGSAPLAAVVTVLAVCGGAAALNRSARRPGGRP